MKTTVIDDEPRRFGYDQRLERLDVALRAIWLLAATNRWELLEHLGLDKETLERGFWEVREDTEYLRTERQAFAFVRGAPRALDAAMEMMRRYAAVSADDRAQWYGRVA